MIEANVRNSNWPSDAYITAVVEFNDANPNIAGLKRLIRGYSSTEYRMNAVLILKPKAPNEPPIFYGLERRPFERDGKDSPGMRLYFNGESELTGESSMGEALGKFVADVIGNVHWPMMPMTRA